MNLATHDPLPIICRCALLQCPR